MHLKCHAPKINPQLDGQQTSVCHCHPATDTPAVDSLKKSSGAADATWVFSELFLVSLALSQSHITLYIPNRRVY